MKRLSYYVPCIGLILILSISVCWAQEAGLPKIYLTEDLFDAKEVKEGTFIEHTFRILNKGDGPLEIKRVKPT